MSSQIGFRSYTAEDFEGIFDVKNKLSASEEIFPWARFLASFIDIQLYTYASCIVSFFLVIITAGETGAVISDSFFYRIYVVVFLFFVIIIDGAITSIFKTSIGKALFAITLRHVDDKTSAYYVRNLYKLCFCYAFFFPLVQLFTLARQRDVYKKNGITNYDRKLNFIVEKRQPRKIIYYLAVVFIFFSTVLFVVTKSLLDTVQKNKQGQAKQEQHIYPLDSVKQHSQPPMVTTSDNGRFTKYSSGVFVDSSTGLEWYPSPNQDYTWDMAKSWVAGLKAAGGGWRMPTRSELAGLKTDTFQTTIKTLKCIKRDSQGTCLEFANEYDGGTRTVDCHRPGVVDWSMACGWVWSGEARESSSAWFFTFNDGKEYWGAREDSGYLRAFAVRSREPTKTWTQKQRSSDEGDSGSSSASSHSSSGRFSKDGQGIIKDKQTGLQWYMGTENNTTWYQAQSWVQSQSVGGGGWRMPTRSELSGLSAKQSGYCIGTIFSYKNRCIFVWSGEIRDSSSAWDFDFSSGKVDWAIRESSDSLRAFAVRSR